MKEKSVLKFTKMQGCGNDYIYLNNLDESLDHLNELAIKLSDRHFGVGGDGIVAINPSKVADAKKRMFNIDGSEGKMCGNAIRCVAKYLYDNGIVKKEVMTIETLSGIKILELFVENGVTKSVKVNMGQAILAPEEIPVKLEGASVINRSVFVNQRQYEITCVSMGNPHCVVFGYDLDNIDLEKMGKAFEFHEIFPDRVNTEFVQIVDKNTMRMRVWERGSGETLACGTGACASVVAAVLNGYFNKDEDITVKLLGGDLIIRYTDEAVFMTGACEKTFEGVVEV